MSTNSYNRSAYNKRLHKSRTFDGETFGQRLRRLRVELSLSQRDVAQQCERVSYAYISRLEGDARDASVRAIREIAGVLGVTASYLEWGEERDIEKAGLLRTIEKLKHDLEAERDARRAAQDRLEKYAQQLREYELRR